MQAKMQNPDDIDTRGGIEIHDLQTAREPADNGGIRTDDGPEPEDVQESEWYLVVGICTSLLWVPVLYMLLNWIDGIH
ncbi:MAG: hypothetical protein JSU70_13600 [Phycisphaerales bacterium]|nr:MAG: hypothetical protein JSU70_13600 [Phycisphaerales bacterium]